MAIPVMSPEHTPAVTAVMSVLAGLLGIATVFLGLGQTFIFGAAAILIGMYPIRKSPNNAYKLLGGIGIILGVIAIVLGVLMAPVAISRRYGMPYGY